MQVSPNRNISKPRSVHCHMRASALVIQKKVIFPNLDLPPGSLKLWPPGGSEALIYKSVLQALEKTKAILVRHGSLRLILGSRDDGARFTFHNIF